MSQHQPRIRSGLLVLDVVEDAVIIDRAILIDLDEGGAFVSVRSS